LASRRFSARIIDEGAGIHHDNNKARQATIHPPRLSFFCTGAAIMPPA